MCIDDTRREVCERRAQGENRRKSASVCEKRSHKRKTRERRIDVYRGHEKIREDVYREQVR